MFNSYNDIRKWRENRMESVSRDHFQLNAFHDQMIQHAFHLAKEKIEREQGPPPAPFAFYLMGSAGRFEQSIWSDQDHGIVFDGKQEHQHYFLKLGEEIREGLAAVGYERCEGNVMASNPLWCQSVEVLQTQISDWLREASWQKLRHFLIFFDSRVLIGDKGLLFQVKKQVFSILEEEPWLFSRLVENVNHVKKGVGIFGQLLPDYSGGKNGNFNLKQTVYFPYVNALRMLALLHHVSAPSTFSRFEAIRSIYPSVAAYEEDFHQLLQHRLQWRNEAESYENVHMLKVDQLPKKDKQQLKTSVRRGQKLYSIAKSIVKEEGWS